jgi:hypothetical protein
VIRLLHPQYVTMVDLLQSVDCMVKNGPYRKFRPEVPVHTNISIWSVHQILYECYSAVVLPELSYSERERAMPLQLTVTWEEEDCSTWLWAPEAEWLSRVASYYMRLSYIRQMESRFNFIVFAVKSTTTETMECSLASILNIHPIVEYIINMKYAAWTE